jgi:hypothetical protein
MARRLWKLSKLEVRCLLLEDFSEIAGGGLVLGMSVVMVIRHLRGDPPVGATAGYLYLVGLVLLGIGCWRPMRRRLRKQGRIG